MKADEAPEKLYVNFHFIETHPGSHQPLVTTQGINKYDIEYMRTDAFIEKFENWMCCDFRWFTNDIDAAIEDFKNT